MTNSDDKPTILLLNDERGLRDLVKYLLLEAGYRVLPAASNTEALALLNDEKIDVLIQDIIRPGGNGLELYWRLRLDESLSRIPVMILSYWPNVQVEQVTSSEKGPNHRYRLTFIPDTPLYVEAEAAVKGIENPGVIRVAGYTKTPMEAEAFLSMVKEVMDGVLQSKDLHVQKSTGKKMTGQILLVDDETTLLEIVAEELRSLGYTVETAQDGVEALEKVKRDAFKLMITCIKMPRLDGIRLSKLVNERSSRTKVLIFSGSSKNTSLEYCKKEGVRIDGVFFKGDPWNELVKTVRQIMTL